MKIINIRVDDTIYIDSVYDTDTQTTKSITSSLKLPTGNYNSILLKFDFVSPTFENAENIFAVFNAKHFENPIAVEINQIDIENNACARACFVPNEVFEKCGEVTLGVFSYVLNVEGELEKRGSLVPITSEIIKGSYEPDALETTVPTPTVFEVYFDKINEAYDTLNEKMMFLKMYEDTYITTSDYEAEIPFNIVQFNKATTLLVFVNGMKLIEGINYIVDYDNLLIKLNEGLDVIGTPVHFICLKSSVVNVEDYDFLKGDKGLSAYEVALENGFKGTEQEWIESLKEYEVISDGNAEGESITITDAGNAPIESIMLKGKTYQETKEGYNICPTDVSNWEVGYYSTVNGTKTTETSNNHTQMARVKDLLKVSPNTAIYFNTFDTSYLFYVRAYDINKNFIENLGVAKNGDYITTGGTCEYIGIGLYKPSNPATNEGQLIINKITNGEMKLLVGEISMPSIDFPSEIQSVTGENEVGVNNKNWLPVKEIEETTEKGLTYSIKNGVLKLNGTTTGSLSILYLYKDIPLNGNYSLMLNQEGTIPTGSSSISLKDSSNKKLSETAMTVKTKQPITFENVVLGANYSNIWINSGFTFENATFKLQLEKGDTATDHIEPQSQNYPISLGENEIFEDGYLNIEYEQNAGYKRVTRASIVNSYEKYIFTGNEGFTMSSRTDVKRYTAKTLFNDATLDTYSIDLFCNYFECITQASSDLGNVGMSKHNQTGVMINLPLDTEFDTLEKFKQWLVDSNTAGTPLEIVYKLATPTETEITDSTLLSQLEALINAETYRDVTHINTVNEGLKPTIKLGYNFAKGLISDKEIQNIKTSFSSQIEKFDYVLAENITKIDDYANECYYNKLTGEVTILYGVNVGQDFNGQHISGFTIPEQYKPAKKLFGVGTSNGGVLLQVTIEPNGNVDLWSDSPTKEARGSISYFISRKE